MTAVIAANGRDKPRPSRNASTIAPARMAIVPRIRLRCELAAAALLGRILDDFENADRLTGVIPDLPEIERGGTAVDRGVAAQRLAVEHALQLA